MSDELEFDFDELPLIVDLGFEAGLVNGTATISYHDDGEWSVREIALDGFRRRSREEMDSDQAKEPGRARLPLFERKPVVVDRASHRWLYDAISDRLENGRFKDGIRYKIEKELGDAGVSLRNPNDEHSTLSRAQQGA